MQGAGDCSIGVSLLKLNASRRRRSLFGTLNARDDDSVTLSFVRGKSKSLCKSSSLNWGESARARERVSERER